MKNREHTPTPWRTWEPETSKLITVECDAGTAENPITGKHICTTGHRNHAEAQANAAFIVKAVNCHEALTVALRRCLDAINAYGIADSKKYDSSREKVKLGYAALNASSALAEAEGK